MQTPLHRRPISKTWMHFLQCLLMKTRVPSHKNSRIATLLPIFPLLTMARLYPLGNFATRQIEYCYILHRYGKDTMESRWNGLLELCINHSQIPGKTGNG